ncbi:MAG TPA: hypothetical protein VF824_10995 [Thermoanaerobaculia bacterium]
MPVKVHAALLALFAAASIAMTWPLAPNLALAVAHPGDPFIIGWVMDWEFHALTHDPARLFHGNIFHPLPWTIAFSENVLGIVLAMLPLLIAHVPVVMLCNVVVLAGFALAGYGAALLGREISGSTWGGIAAGVFFAFVPWRFTHLTHIHHLWTVWLPLLVLALLRLVQMPTRRRATAFAAAFVLNGLTNLHWLAFGSASIALAAAIALPFAAERKRYAMHAAAALAVGALALAPLLYPYWRAEQLYRMRGDRGETEHYSGTLEGWRTASLHNRLYGQALNHASIDPELWMFPGVLGPVLAIAGLRSRKRLPLAIALALIALGFLASLGLHTFVGRFLFEYVPLFRGIRVPARWAMIVYLGVSMLIALALPRRAVAIAASLLLLVELRAAPIRWYLTTGRTPQVYRWLARQDLRGGALLELPMEQARVYPYLLHATAHHQPMLDGVSGWKPPYYAALETLAASGSPAFYDAVRARGATVVLAHGVSVGAPFRFVGRFAPHDDVYALPGLTLSPIDDVAETRGALLHPVHWELCTGPLEVRGTFTSPRPIAKVVLWFDNRRTRYAASFDATTFHRTFAVRPDDVRPDTDLQVDLVDDRGEVTHLPQAWLRWQRPGEHLPDGQLPQTADLGPYLVHPRHEDGFARTRPPE